MKDGDFMKKVAATVARNRSKRAFDRSMMHPEREWFLCITFLIIGIAAAAFWSTTNYSRFSGASIASESGEGNSSVYKGEMVTAALTLLEERAAEYESLKSAMMNRRSSVSVPISQPEPEPTIVPEAQDEPVIESEPEPEVEPVTESTPTPVLDEEVVAELGV
jgi:hypothetical protein